MVRFVLLLLLLTSLVHALSDSAILKRADGFMSSKNKSDHFRAYNDYKTLYLRATISQNEKLKLTAVKGIVESGNSLHIDVSKYSNELSQLDKQTKVQINKPTTQAKIKKSDNKNIQITDSSKLKGVRFKDDVLVLEFDSNIDASQINSFTLYDAKQRTYRYVYDIHASMLTKSETLRKKGIERIKVAQFNTKTIRLVISNNKQLNLRLANAENKVFISFSSKGSASVEVTPKRLDRNKVIVIDPGHGGKDPGAMGYKRYREKVVVLQIAKELRTILKSRGYKVYLTRSGDNFVKLSNRTKFVNKKNADIFISIHANAVSKKDAYKVNGIECYFLSKSRSSRAKRVAAKENSADLSEMDYYGKETLLSTINSHNIVASNKLAIDLQRGMLGSLKKSYKNVTDGGVREGPFWVLVGAQMPSVLVEVGFISHPVEARRLVSSKYQKKLALGMADGIERYFANN